MISGFNFYLFVLTCNIVLLLCNAHLAEHLYFSDNLNFSFFYFELDSFYKEVPFMKSTSIPGKILYITFGFKVCILQYYNSLNIKIICIHNFIMKKNFITSYLNKNTVFL